MENKKKVFSAEIELSEKQTKNIIDKVGAIGMTDAQVIEGVAIAALEDIADGGILLSGSEGKQLRSILGDVDSNQAIVDAVEAGVGRKDGGPQFFWRVDPTEEPYYRQQAEIQGISFENFSQAVVDWGVANGWAGALSPGTAVIFITQADLNEVSKILGVDYANGTQMADFIKKHSYEQAANVAVEVA